MVGDCGYCDCVLILGGYVVYGCVVDDGKGCYVFEIDYG